MTFRRAVTPHAWMGVRARNRAAIGRSLVFHSATAAQAQGGVPAPIATRDAAGSPADQEGPPNSKHGRQHHESDETPASRRTGQGERSEAGQGVPRPRIVGIPGRPLFGERQRVAEPGGHHHQLHARRDEPRRRRDQQPELGLQRQGGPERTLAERHPPGGTGLGAADQHQLHRRPRRWRVGRGGPRRAGRPRVRRHPDRRLQLRQFHPGLDLSAASPEQFLHRRRHDVQHRPELQHRLHLRPVHRGHARVRPRDGAQREQRDAAP